MKGVLDSDEKYRPINSGAVLSPLPFAFLLGSTQSPSTPTYK